MQDTILALMKLISHIFEPEIMFPFIFLLGLATYFLTKHKTSSYIIMSSSIITMLIVKTLKIIIDKPRPENMLIAESIGKAFPSGHSAVAAVFTVLVIYFLSIHLKRASQKNTFLEKNKNILFTFVVTIFLLIPYSRLYLHVHDVYDISAGYIIGLVITILCVKYFKKFFKNN